MLELLVQLKWNYVAIVYDDDDYGRSAATELRRLAEGRELCVPVFESVPLDVSSATFQTRAASIEEQVLKNTRHVIGSPLHSLYNPWESLSPPPPSPPPHFFNIF